MNPQDTPPRAQERPRDSQDRPRRWSPSPLLYASAAVHVRRAAAAVLARPRAWPWALGAVAANHVGLAAAGLWPRSQLLGPNWIRLPVQSGVSARAAITIDDGPDPAVTPQVLAQLAEHGAHATFFCVGLRVERYADLAREIVSRGHHIENHSQRHRHNFSLLGPGGMAAEIARAQDSIFRVTGCQPTVFSRARRTAQSVSRPRIGPAAVAPGQLDAPRFRHRQCECGCRIPAPGEPAARRRYLIAPRRQRSPQPAAARR